MFDDVARDVPPESCRAVARMLRRMAVQLEETAKRKERLYTNRRPLRLYKGPEGPLLSKAEAMLKKGMSWSDMRATLAREYPIETVDFYIHEARKNKAHLETVRRNQDIVRRAALGQSSRAIAQALGVSARTVQRVLKRLERTV